MNYKNSIILESGLINFKPSEIYFYNRDNILYDLDYLGNVFGNFLRMTEGIPLVTDKTAANTNWTTNLIQFKNTKTNITQVLSIDSSSGTISYFNLNDSTGFEIDDAICFNRSFSIISRDSLYYITDITGNTITLSPTRGGTSFKNILSGSTTPIYIYEMNQKFYTGSYIINGTSYNLFDGNVDFSPFPIASTIGEYYRIDTIYLTSSGINILEGVTSSIPNEYPYTTDTIILGYSLLHYNGTGYPIITLTIDWTPIMIDPFFYQPLIDNVDILMTSGVTGGTINYMDIDFLGTAGDIVYNNYDQLRRIKIFDDIKAGLWHTSPYGAIVNLINGTLYTLRSISGFTYHERTSTTNGKLRFYLGTEDPNNYYSNGDFIIYYSQ